jgi:hypothetical protein
MTQFWFDWYTVTVNYETLKTKCLKEEEEEAIFKQTQFVKREKKHTRLQLAKIRVFFFQCRLLVIEKALNFDSIEQWREGFIFNQRFL